jgi:hypothetical protein
MRIVLHLGAHATDQGAIANWLAASAPMLEEDGVRVVPPSAFRPAVHELIQTLRGSPAPRAVEQDLIDRLCAGARPERIVLSHPWLLGPAGRILESRGFYPVAGQRLVSLCNLFPSHRIELALAVRQPMPFLAAVLALQSDIEAHEFWSRAAAHVLDWGAIAGQLRDHAPQAGLTLWRHEDLGTIWPEVGAALVGAEARLPVQGFAGLLGDRVSPDGLRKLEDYLAATAIEARDQAVRLADIFALRFPAVRAAAPSPAALAEKGLAPPELVAAIADADAAYAGLETAVAALRGVRLISP